MLEVTPGGKIVWEYTDVRVHHAVRVAKDWVKFPLEGMMKGRGRPAGETADAGATNG